MMSETLADARAAPTEDSAFVVTSARRDHRRPRFSRFRDLDRAAVNVDYQIHTVETDGEATIEELLSLARGRGLGSIAFTEHVRRSTDWFPRFAAQVRAAAVDHPELDVFVGCETKANDRRGTLDLSEEILDASEIVLGSVHRFPHPDGGYYRFEDLGREDMATIEFELAMGMVRNAPIDVLSHPGGMYQRRHGAFPEELFREMMTATLERGIAIEINSSYLVDIDSFLRLCAEIDPFVSIGSDVHRPSELGQCRDLLLARGVAA